MASLFIVGPDWSAQPSWHQNGRILPTGHASGAGEQAHKPATAVWAIAATLALSALRRKRLGGFDAPGEGKEPPSFHYAKLEMRNGGLTFTHISTPAQQPDNGWNIENL